MDYLVSIPAHKLQFSVTTGETILQAAKRQAIPLPFGCEIGECGSCKTRVVSGSFSSNENDARNPEVLDGSDIEHGYILSCSAIPGSDMELEVPGLVDWRVMILPTKIQNITSPCDEVVILQLRLPPSIKFNFKAGQYVEFIFDDGLRRSFSMANPPFGSDEESDNKYLEFHIRKYPGGVFSGMLPRLRVGSLIRIEGPFGQFFLHDDEPGRPMIMLAGGTGFAPIQSVMQDMINREARGEGSYRKREIAFYWGVKTMEHLYLDAPLLQWRNFFSKITINVIVSDESEDSIADYLASGQDFELRHGLVHEAVLNDFPSMAGCDVYACGSPAMIEAAKNDFMNLAGLPVQRFFADSFTLAAKTD